MGANYGYAGTVTKTAQNMTNNKTIATSTQSAFINCAYMLFFYCKREGDDK